MSAIGYLLEIAGLPWALASSPNAPVQFSQTVYEYLLQAPSSAPIRTDIIEGTSDTGGASYMALNVANAITSNFLQQLTQNAHTRMTTELLIAGTSFDVESPGALTGATYVYVEEETIKVGSISTNTVNVATGGRGQFGSEDRDHSQYAATDGGQFPLVYAFPPNLSGRRCWMWRYDQNDPTDKTLMAAGFLENVQWHPDGSMDFSIRSLQQKLRDSRVLEAPFAKGQLLYDENTNIVAIDGLEVQLENPDVPFKAPNASLDRSYITLTDEKGNVELIAYYRVKERHISDTTSSGSTTNTLVFSSTLGFRAGDTIEVALSSPERAQVRALNSTQLFLSRDLSSAPSAGVTVEVISRMQILPPLYRGGNGIINTQRLPLADKMKVDEVRVFSGNQIEIFRQLLYSRKGGRVNTNYDVLDAGWGAGIDDSIIDSDSFDELKARAGARRYLFREGFSLWDMAQWIMRSCGCYIYTNRDGRLYAQLVRTRYPDDASVLTVDTSNVYDSLIEHDANEDRIRNAWEWGADRPLLDQTGDPKVLHRFLQPDSKALFGYRPLAPLDDPGLFQGSEVEGLVVAEMIFARIARVWPLIKIPLPFEQAKTLLPGQYISLTWGNIPDHQGGQGVTSQLYEVSSVMPKDSDEEITTEAMLIYQGRHGLIAPAGRVQAYDIGAKTVTFFAQSITLLSQSGTEDSDQWKVGHPVRFYDYSTFSGTVTTATATITAMDYPGRTMTVDAIPAWIAQDDIIEPGDWDDWSGLETSDEIEPTDLDWQSTHVHHADETASPPDLGSGGDAAFRYGG